MGCTQCIHKKSSSLDLEKYKLIRRKLILQKLKQLKSCKMIKQQQLSKVKKMIRTKIDPQTQKKHQISKQQLHEIQQNISKTLQDTWKCLVFCSGSDLYQEHLGIDFSIKHKCFSDIEKDIGRTFPERQQMQSSNKIQQFKQTLQKISLYFPQLGYTQGINFLVGYLMVLKFPKEDVFWMIIHLFLKQQYLFIGFFQNQFPLTEIYCQLFQFLFRKYCPNLSTHFLKLNVNDKMWIFKWFMTAYIYSFPSQTLQFIWDYLMVVGGFGLIYIAISLVRQLQNTLKQFQEDLQIIQFLTQLKNKQIFQSLVNLQCVILKSYQIKLSQYQVQQIILSFKQNTKINNFYIEYYSNFADTIKRDFILKSWHNKKIDQRLNYSKKHSRSFLVQKQLKLKRFRVKKQRNEGEVIALPKTTVQSKQSEDSLSEKDKQKEQQKQIQSMKQQPLVFKFKQSEIGQFSHKISFKKKKINVETKQFVLETIPLIKQMSEKVLIKKQTPHRIKRQLSRRSQLSDKSNKQSSREPSDNISMVKAQLGMSSSDAIEQSLEEIYFNHNPRSAGSTK